MKLQQQRKADTRFCRREADGENGLVVAFHVGREERAGEVLSNRKDDSAKRKTEEHA